MVRFLAVGLMVLGMAGAARALEIEDLEPIGAVKSLTKDATGVTFSCEGGSTVRVNWLAPDLARVRASFGGPLPTLDHSWAVEKTAWASVPFTVEEGPAAVTLTSSELRVVVEKSPLKIEFQDREGHTLNRDQRPMMWDAHQKHQAQLFDPKSGPMIAVAKELPLEEHYYGLGEKAARLDKRRGSFTMWNSDTPAYTPGKDPIYQSIPFYLGLNEGRAYGIFFDNSYKSYFDFGFTTQAWAGFAAEGGDLDYYFFWGPSIPKILGRYTELTGRMPMPPRWALGHQASRWSYYPEKMVEDIAATYQAHDIPLDVMTLDIDYMQAYRVFTWDTQRFPNPSALAERLRKKGLRLVTIVDPGVKYQPVAAPNDKPSDHPELDSQKASYYVYNQGTMAHYFVTQADGTAVIPKVWPGEAVFVDFTLEAARKWWGDLHRGLLDQGVGGIWNDMNEPADFVEPTGSHLRESVYDDLGRKTRHAKNRNVFALLMARATYEGMQRLRPLERPYVITRAAYAGIQRFSTMWTGDACSTWDGLTVSVPMFTTLGLSGESFIGSDVGGFVGRADGELIVRAYQICFLVPFCRNHKEISGYDQEPWRFGPYYEGIIRRYLKLRYKLLPYLYARLEEAHRTGLPPIRPLLLSEQADADTWNLDDEFTVGHDLLVAPVTKPDVERRRVYLPKGLWYDYWTGKAVTGGTTRMVDASLENVPFFVRGGSVIPMGPEKNTTETAPNETLTLQIYPDVHGMAQGTLYDDDGHSTAYKQGAYARRQVLCRVDGARLRIVVGAPEGNYHLPSRPLRIVWKGQLSLSSARWDGKEVSPSKIEGVDDGRSHQIEILLNTRAAGRIQRFE